jgi:C-terminal, D2-small domain, of ClpB protein
LGFGAIAGHGSYEAMRDKILDESKRVFKPEFLNRLDDMIVFHQLERNDLVKIVDLEVAKVIERVRAKDIKVHLDRTAVEFLIDKGYDPIYGARPMRRATGYGVRLREAQNAQWRCRLVIHVCASERPLWPSRDCRNLALILCK